MGRLNMLSDLELVLIDKSVQWQAVDVWRKYLAEKRLLENKIASIENKYNMNITEIFRDCTLL